jgi:hypothetical protein
MGKYGTPNANSTTNRLSLMIAGDKLIMVRDVTSDFSGELLYRLVHTAKGGISRLFQTLCNDRYDSTDLNHEKNGEVNFGHGQGWVTIFRLQD